MGVLRNAETSGITQKSALFLPLQHGRVPLVRPAFRQRQEKEKVAGRREAEDWAQKTKTWQTRVDINKQTGKQTNEPVSSSGRVRSCLAEGTGQRETYTRGHRAERAV